MVEQNDIGIDDVDKDQADEKNGVVVFFTHKIHLYYNKVERRRVTKPFRHKEHGAYSDSPDRNRKTD